MTDATDKTANDLQHKKNTNNSYTKKTKHADKKLNVAKIMKIIQQRQRHWVGHFLRHESLLLGSDVSAWTRTVLKHRNLVLGLVLEFESQVLGLGLDV